MTECRIIKVDGMPTKSLLRYTSISVLSRDNFIELSTGKAYNAAPGSFFEDKAKAYFFSRNDSPICYMWHNKKFKGE